MELDWAIAIVLISVHLASVAVVVAMVWYRPLPRQERAREKVRKGKEINKVMLDNS